ncbi:MAG: hypothetical protein HOI53_09515 [Francisellaceae bacterium]|nr:hypothetical protein [Francisellaceae bacterium]MBT6208251.1 hypothetical protein [Francisellaceae bacterium]MBT6537879.1 hypothetical protein [Francisellaceae bacterium]
MAQLDVQRASQMQMVATAKLEADISNISGSVSQDLASAVKSVVFSTKDHLDVNNSIKVLDKLTEYSLTDGTSIETSMAIDKLKSMIIDTVDLHAMDNVLTIEQQERLDNEIQNMRALTKLNEYVDHLHGVRQASMVSKKLAIIYPKLEQLRAGTNLKEIIDNTFLDQISLSRRAGAGESCGMKVAKSLEVMVGCAQTTKNYQSVELDEYP